MHRRRVGLVLGAFIAVASLIVAGAAGGARGKASAGTMVFGAEQEPPCLNGFLEGCNNTWTAWTAGLALPGAYIVRPNFTFRAGSSRHSLPSWPPAAISSSPLRVRRR